VIRIQTDASPFFSSLVFFKKKSTLNELSDQGVIEKDQRRLLIRQPEELDRMASMDVAAP
jgi:uncharacterized membrane protein YobD (UPF0266 family)